MIINRYNYEEYFLLYIDNELDVAERNAVERFVEENADLKNELLGFRDAVLYANEKIKFPGKKELLSSKASLSIINNDNYAEYFLLYADNELSNNDKSLVEQYVYHHPKLQGEFELLLKVKMEPDRTITFHNKEMLMRHQEKTRVIAGWWKIIASVAAALLFLVFGYLKYNGDNETSPGALISQKTDSGVDDQQKRTPLIVIENKVDTPAANTSEQIEPAGQQSEPVAVDGIRLGKSTRLKDLESGLKSSSDLQKSDQAKVSENIQAVKPTEAQTIELPKEIEIKVAISGDHIQTLRHENLQQENAPTIAVRTDEAQESETSIAGIPVTSKSKVGKFILRTSRFINKTKKDISSKSGLNIGNLEIAIR